MNDNLEALLFLLRLPYLILSRMFRPSKPPPPKSSLQTREATLKRIEINEPTPLPRIRPRTLTLEDLQRRDDSACCSRGVVKEAQRSIPPLFKLPLEVRQMIYTEVLGEQTLHIVRRRKRLGFLRCRAPRPEDCPMHPCLGIVDGDGVWTKGFSGKEKTDGGLLDLTLVSRRVYVAVSFPLALPMALLNPKHTLRNIATPKPLPFSTRLTNFTSPPSSRSSPSSAHFSLQRTLLPRRLAAITSLALYWHIRYPFYVSAPAVLHHPPPQDEATWEEFWRIVPGEMLGLKRVRVRIWHADMGLDGEGERMMLAPLRAIGLERGLKVMIWLPWKGKDEGEVAQGLILTREKT